MAAMLPSLILLVSHFFPPIAFPTEPGSQTEKEKSLCVLCDLLNVRCVKNCRLFTETRVFAPSNPFH
jgi:hypothetical protein